MRFPHSLMRQRHSVLRLDLRGPTMDGRVAFTRATAASYFDPTGFMVQAASGAPRFEFNPATLAPLGLLLEDARTNLCLRNSAPNNATWVKTNATGTANSQTGPDNTASYGSLTASAANGTCLQTITVVNGTTYQFSIRMKRLVGTGSIQITTDNGTTWNTVAVTGTLTRFTQQQVASGTSMVVGVRIVTNADSVVFGGAQLEAGAYASSELSTAGASTVRNIDAATIVVPTDFYENGASFTMMAELQPIALAGTTRLLQLAGSIAPSNNTAINADASGNVTVTHTVASSGQTSGNVGQISVGNVAKVGVSLGPYGLLTAVNGVLGTTTPVDRPSPMTVAMASLVLGQASGTGSVYLRRVAFWKDYVTPDRLTLATAP